MKIGICGLGKLGLSYAAVLSEAGYDVYGVDALKESVDKINRNESPIDEPGLPKLLKEHPIHASTNYHILQPCKLIFIVVPTPSFSSGNFDDKIIRNCLNEFKNNNLKPDLVNIVSTVSPQNCYKLSSDYGFNITYNPSLIALGRIISDLHHPDFVMIGCDDRKSFNTLKEIHEKIYSLHNKDEPKIYQASQLEVEIAKIALNVYVTQKINFANILGEICDKLSEENIATPNVDNITEMIGNDKRIGHQYLKSGMAFGGPCFPRDNMAFYSFAKGLEIDAKNCKFTDENNKYQPMRICHKIKKILNRDNLKKTKVAILGAAYKPNTTYRGESPSIWLQKELQDYGSCAVIWDKSDGLGSLRAALDDADLAIIAHADIELSEIYIASMKHKKILDCWRTNKHLEKSKGVEYYALGA